MPSKSFFARCFKTPKTPEQRMEELRSHAKRRHHVSTLPLDQSWPHYPLRSYQGFWFPETVLPGIMALQEDFKADPTDLFLVTYPKSGTTWLKALTFAISNHSSFQSHDHPLLHRHPHDCSPYLEGLFSVGPTPDLGVLQSPRLLATHIPYPSLPESVRSECRILYLCRDPKDTLVSMWHFGEATKPEGMQSSTFPFAGAFDVFCIGRVAYGPVWEHMLGYWEESRRRPGEVMFLRYEEMMEDPGECVRRLAGFMGRPFTAAEEKDGAAEEIVRLCSFESLSGLEVNKVGVMGEDIGWSMKKSSFFRKGKVGAWREHLSPEMANRLDRITQQKLDGSGLTFNPQFKFCSRL